MEHCSIENIDEREANVRLIAAAPELLEALYFMRQAAAELFYLHNDSDSETVEEAHEQFRRAEQMFYEVVAKTKGD